jgi:hypothetical protein
MTVRHGSILIMAEDSFVQTGSGGHPVSYPIATREGGATSSVVKWPGREFDRRPPSTAEVKMLEPYIHSFISSLNDAQLSREANSFPYLMRRGISSGVFP